MARRPVLPLPSAKGWIFSNFAWKKAAAVKTFSGSSGSVFKSSNSSRISSGTSSADAPVSLRPVT